MNILAFAASSKEIKGSVSIEFIKCVQEADK